MHLSPHVAISKGNSRSNKAAHLEWLRHVKPLNALYGWSERLYCRFRASTNHARPACSFSSAHIVQRAQHHVFIRSFAKETASDAVAGSSAVSARIAAALHFRAALPPDAATRTSASSHVLRYPHQTELPRMACTRRLLSF